MKTLLPIILLIVLPSFVSAQNVGIGTTSPQAKLHVSGGNSVFTATSDVPATPGPAPVAGEGRRMMWYADRAALRAGYASGSEWDTDNVGFYSVALGGSTTASGDGTTALGMDTRAVGYVSLSSGYQTLTMGSYATAMGFRSQAWGESSVAIGHDVRAMGNFSTALGYQTNADLDYTTAIGHSATASGNYSMALGNSTTSSGEYATALGNQTTASGNYSTAMGHTTTSSGMYATAIGHTTQASGAYSTAMGIGVSTAGYNGAFILGDYRTTTTNSTAANQITLRFRGGYRFLTSTNGDGTAIGVALAANGNSWTTVSDSTKKENFVSANGKEFLKKIAAMRLGSWNYKEQDKTSYRHYGPMAQEFFAAFGHDGIGTIGNDTTIASADIDGVMMIALKALIKENQELKENNASITNRLERLEAILAKPNPSLSARNDRNQ